MRSKFRTLSPVAFLGVLALAQAGCLTDSSDDSAFFLDWTVVHVGDTVATTCDDVGAATVAFEATNLDTSARYPESFNCASGAGTTRTMPVGDYTVVIRLKDDLGAVLSETSGANVRISRTGLTYLPTAVFDVQSWILGWSIQRMTAAGPLLVTCAEARAATVQLETQLAGEKPLKYDFPCAAMSGRTTGIGVAPYVVTVRLLDAAGGMLSATAPEVFNVTATERADLGSVAFAVM